MSVDAGRDVLDLGVKLWSLWYFSREMGWRKKGSFWTAVCRVFSLAAFSLFTLFQRYFLAEQSLSEAYLRNLLLYLLTCFLMLSFRRGQHTYLVFLASIVFFLWGGWMKLFSPQVFSLLHLPTFGYPLEGRFPIWPVTIGENICRVLVILAMKRFVFAISPEREITPWEAFLSLLPPLIGHMTVLINYYLTMVAPSESTRGISSELSFLSLLLAFGVPAMLAATEQRFALQRREVMLLRMESQMKEQIQAYENRVVSDETARRIYHDLNKHLQVLEKMAGKDHQKTEEEALQAYLTELITKQEELSEQVHTGNPVLDSLLSQKLDQAREMRIRLECMVDFAEGSFLRYGDVVILFGNMLENAMEAVLPLPEEKRVITVSAGVIGDYLVVKCRNPYEGEREKRPDGLFSTSKGDSSMHGLGLGNLKRIVESYEGFLSLEEEGEWFQVEWMIPVPEKGMEG